MAQPRYSVLNSPRGLAFDSTGNLFVANYGSNAIERFTPGGVASFFAGNVNSPFDLAFDSAGRLYASHGLDTILRFTPDGTASVFANTTPSSFAYGLAFDSAGRLFNSGRNGNIIDEFTTAGVRSTFDTAGLNFPTFIAFEELPLSVPEPTSAALLLGSGLLLSLRRRRGAR